MLPSARRATLNAILIAALAACQAGTGSVSPSASVPGTESSAGSSQPASLAASPLTGQTDTDWGRIWDALPPDFPSYPGSAPAEGAAGGPVSAVLAVAGVEAKAVADWMQSRLVEATYSTDALSGPLEDGSYVLEATGSAPGCRVQVSVAPLGGLTTVTVRYGASCRQP